MSDDLADRLSGLGLWPHHVETIRNVVAHFESDDAALALLLGGSLAHGLGGEGSDVDIVVVVGAAEYARRAAVPDLTIFNRELATYEGGYVDGKYVDVDFLRLVAERGSDPARWAFDGARTLFSRVAGLAGILEEIRRYPTEDRDERVRRFAAQLLAWRWYYGEGTAKGSAYLHTTALHKIVLFASRLVLAQNAMFYPFHKWMLRVVADAPNRPADLPERLDALLAAPSDEGIDALIESLFAHYGLDRTEADRTWGTRFMADTELAWLRHPPIDEL